VIVIIKTYWQWLVLNFDATTGYRVKRRTVKPVIFNSGTDTIDPWSQTAKSQIDYSGTTYDFAFWSITAQDTTSPQQTAQIQQGLTGNDSHSGGQWIVTANAYYIPHFGNGTTEGGDGFVWIDAFDIQLGDFIPDDFVDVKPDPTGTLTVEANNGYIDTKKEITAGDSITIAARDMLHNKRFSNWLPLKVLGSATVGTPDVHDIVAYNNDLVVAFSFYNEVPPGPPLYFVDWNRWAYILTGFGTQPPIGPVDPFAREAAAALSLQVAAKTVAPQLQKRVLEISLEQLQLAVGTLQKQLNLLEG
jgi:hypothetical protein